MIANSLHKIEAGGDLSAQEAEEVMDELLEGHLAQEQIVRLLVSLRAKGEAVDELVGFARAMRRRANLQGAQAQISPLVDTCGTGGDGGGTFNVSTAAALVVRAPACALPSTETALSARVAAPPTCSRC